AWTTTSATPWKMTPGMVRRSSHGRVRPARAAAHGGAGLNARYATRPPIRVGWGLAALPSAPSTRHRPLRGGRPPGGPMPGYQVREIEHAVAGRPFRLRVLSDTQQFADPDGHGERAGISSATWSLFGQLWPAGALLAHAMERFDIEGKRILELGCGIGLAS